MIVFSTVLEVNGQPTVYSVYKNKNLAFLNPNPSAQAPILFATLSHSSWHVKGTEDDKLVRQAIREVVGSQESGAGSQ